MSMHPARQAYVEEDANEVRLKHPLHLHLELGLVPRSLHGSLLTYLCKQDERMDGIDLANVRKYNCILSQFYYILLMAL